MHVLCPHCQDPIKVVDFRETLEVLCPSCGSTFRLADGSTATWSPAQGLRRLGRFELIDAIGKGSFGTVYKARDTQLDRIVAIKVPRAGDRDEPDQRARFLREARSVAQLRHPSIVSIHEVGEHEGWLFLVGDFIQGITLDDLLSARRPAPRDSAIMVETIAGALQYAHEGGVVHRDVKPSNILLDDQGRPYLMDFGLAKRSAGEVTMTLDGQVLGTPAYMSPEQAQGEGHDVDGRSDVYSLGVVLYRLLTGELPFRGTSRMLLHQVLNDEPKPPRRLNDRIPRDLETICLKAMAKSPTRRYASAGELAADLRRYLDGVPILARRVGPLGRGWRWARRNPALAGSLAAVGMLLVALAVGSAAYAWQQREVAFRKTRLASERTELAREREEARRRTEAERRTIAANLYRARLGQATAVRLSRAPGYRRKAWDLLREAIALDVEGKDLDQVRDEVAAGLGDPIGLDPIASPATTRAHGTPDASATTPPADPAEARAVGQGGLLVARPGHGGEVILTTGAGALIGNAATTLGTIHALAFSHDARHLVAACEEGHILWEVPSLQVRNLIRGVTTHAVAVHPDDHLYATRDDWSRIELWSLASHRLIAGFRAPAGTRGLDFSADGILLLAIGQGGAILEGWPVARTPEKAQLRGHGGGIPDIAFSPDGRLLATASKDRTVRLWDVHRGALLRTCSGHEAQVQSVAFSPDGSTVASGDWKGVLRLWDAATGREVGRLDANPHLGQIWRVRFDPQGRYLAAAGYHGAVGWRLDPLSRVPRPLEFARVGVQEAMDLAVVPPGRHWLVVDRTGIVHAYDLEHAEGPWALSRRAHPIHAVAATADGRRIWSTGDSDTIGSWDWRRDASDRPDFGSGFRSLAVTFDDRWGATSRPGDRIVILDLDRRREWLRLPSESERPWCWDWSPDGTLLAVGLASGAVVIWDLAEIRAQLAPFGVALPSTKRRPDRRATMPVRDRADFETTVEVNRGRSDVDVLTSRALSEYDDQDRAPEIAELLNVAARRAADHPEAWTLIGKTAFRIERYFDSERAFLKANELEQAAASRQVPGLRRGTAAAIAHELVRLYGALGLWDEAASAFEREYAILPPGLLHLWHGDALLHLLAGDRDGYLRRRRQMRERMGDHIFPSAANLLARTIAVDPESPENPEDALALADLAVKASGESSWYLYVSGLALYRAGQFEEAIRRLRAAKPDDAKGAWVLTWPVLALAYHRSGNLVEARRWMERADDFWTDSARTAIGEPTFRPPLFAWWDVADFLLLRLEATTLIRGTPPRDDAAQSLLRGRALAELHRWDEAARAFDQASRLGLGDAQVRLSTGRLYLQQGRLREAEAAFRAAVASPGTEESREARETTAEAWIHLGITLFRHHHRRGAIDALLRGAECYGALADTAQPSKDNDHHIRYKEKQIRFLAHAGELLGLEGQTVEAVRRLSAAGEMAIRLARDHPSANRPSTLAKGHEWLGRAHLAGGRSAQALDALQVALRNHRQIPSPSPTLIYDEACLVALISGLEPRATRAARPDTSTGRADQARVAVTTLRRAIRAGYGDLARIEADRDLDGLRNRPDFLELLADLRFPSDPFAPDLPPKNAGDPGPIPKTPVAP